jgi:hypothetical protein
MKRLLTLFMLIFLFAISPITSAQVPEKVVDIPARSDVTQRFLHLNPENPKASVILFTGGDGGLQINDNGDLRWGSRNFLVRSRQIFAESGLAVVVIDAPSDRQLKPFLHGFHQTR